ncbi:MAG: divergent polysaccharide deacetylase family protein [Desulfobacterales bacterium]|nr:divergent polysaccharide deacetylase family protein [Desulfobacterales bacterium]
MPHVKGVNNHMGSRLTAQSEQIYQIFSVLKRRGLLFHRQPHHGCERMPAFGPYAAGPLRPAGRVSGSFSGSRRSSASSFGSWCGWPGKRARPWESAIPTLPPMRFSRRCCPNCAGRSNWSQRRVWSGRRVGSGSAELGPELPCGPGGGNAA